MELEKQKILIPPPPARKVLSHFVYYEASPAVLVNYSKRSCRVRALTLLHISPCVRPACPRPVTAIVGLVLLPSPVILLALPGSAPLLPLSGSPRGALPGGRGPHPPPPHQHLTCNPKFPHQANH